MKKLMGLVATVATVGSMAMAQDSTDGESGEGLSVGQIVVEPEITKFEDWNYICITNDEDQKSCLAQHVIDSQRGGRVSTIDIFPIAQETGFGAGASIAFPLGVSLSDGLEILIDGTPVQKYNFVICTSEGCIARIGLYSSIIEQMANGADTKLKVMVGLEEKVEAEFEISTNGFAEIIEELMTNAPQIIEQTDDLVATGEAIVEPEIEVFDDWTRACLTDEEGNKLCRIRQILLNESGGPLATVDVFKVSEDERFLAGIEILLPHGVTLEDGLEVQVDGALPRRYEFTTCLRDGCLARIGLSSSELNRMKSGSEMKLVFYAGIGSASERQFDVSSSLIGFTKAFNSL